MTFEGAVEVGDRRQRVVTVGVPGWLEGGLGMASRTINIPATTNLTPMNDLGHGAVRSPVGWHRLPRSLPGITPTPPRTSGGRNIGARHRRDSRSEQRRQGCDTESDQDLLPTLTRRRLTKPKWLSWRKCSETDDDNRITRLLFSGSADGKASRWQRLRRRGTVIHTARPRPHEVWLWCVNSSASSGGIDGAVRWDRRPG